MSLIFAFVNSITGAAVQLNRQYISLLLTILLYIATLMTAATVTATFIANVAAGSV